MIDSLSFNRSLCLKKPKGILKSILKIRPIWEWQLIFNKEVLYNGDNQASQKQFSEVIGFNEDVFVL